MDSKSLTPLRIVVIGAGNVAFQLSKSLSRAGHIIAQVVNRTEANAKLLASMTNCGYTIDAHKTLKDTDLYILAVPDGAITELCSTLPKLSGLVVHTSGSTSLDVLSPLGKDFGVFYPFQTFSKDHEVNLTNIPFCLEASSPSCLDLLKQLALSLGGNPIEMDSKQRQMLHLAGVFSCNFVNHMLAIAQILAEENEFDFQLLSPLVLETIKKALDGDPLKFQTGPASRGDSETIKKHLALLSRMDDDLRDLYLSLSTSIMNFKQS